MNLSNLGVSLLRTAIPTAWGALIAFLLVHLPSLPHVVVLFLQSQEPAVTGAAVFLWYALWRWLEKRLPAWLARLVLGSALTPSYAPVVAGVAQITTLPAVPVVPTVTVTSFPIAAAAAASEPTNLTPVTPSSATSTGTAPTPPSA